MFCYKKNEGEFGWHSLQRGVNISILEGKEEDLKKNEDRKGGQGRILNWLVAKEKEREMEKKINSQGAVHRSSRR